MPNVMPEDVPVLEPRDMLIGPMRRGKCGCLLGHAFRVFPQTDPSTSPEIVGAFVKAHGDMGTGVPERIEQIGAVPYATMSSDVGRVKKLTVSRVWNRAMAYLGYVVGNPECDRNGKLKPVGKAKR